MSLLLLFCCFVAVFSRVSNRKIYPEDFNNLRIYQVMVSSFQNGDSSVGYGTGYGPSSHNGDLRGIINALEYIKDLGMNTLWMTPVFNSNGNSKLDSTGYFAYDYFNVDPKFGTNDELKELIDKAHDLGLFVLLDGVFGHHKSGDVAASPNGNYPSGGNDPVSYPGSLEFYKEVALYWIDNYEIDGWRLDQAYQVSTRYQDQNYWTIIRQAIESRCDERRSAGKTWGTLGYMVGEIWDSASNINNWGYYGTDGYGLRSCFHFPGRYNLVQTFACEESGAGGYDASNLKNIFSAGYPDYAYPNLFLTNHDVWRFGNLIRKKYGYGQDNDDYWKRHKVALAFMAAYTGPITIYYGDEVGDIVECYYEAGDCGAYDDNMARTDGHISNFNSKQQDLHDYVQKINEYSTCQDASGTLYKDLKTYGSNKIQVIINTNSWGFNCYVDSGTDLISGEYKSGKIYLEPLTAYFIKLDS
ncbi:Cyclomaltodextrinase [Entamoeba marina]